MGSDELITTADFARRQDVSRVAVTRAIQGGRLRAYGKHGEPFAVGTNWRKQRFLRAAEAAKDWHAKRLRFNGGNGHGKDCSELRALRAETTWLQAELLANRQRGALIPLDEARADIERLGRGIRRIYKSAAFTWAGELGVPLALMREKFAALSNATADLLAAEAKEINDGDE